MTWKVFIDGKEGTTGLKIFERFQKRNDIEILQIDPVKRKDLKTRIEMMETADVTFLCLPDSAAKEIVEKAPRNARILDASTAHRTEPDFVYGFPELNSDQREKIKNANRVAVPGCHATGFISLVNPLIAMGIAPKDYPFTCHSITGYSGGGKKMIEEYEREGRDPELDSPRQYGLPQEHKHLREMKFITGIEYSPIFNPIVADFKRGMTVTVPLHKRLLSKKISPEELSESFRKYYENQKFIHVKKFGEETEKGFLGSNNVAGKNYLEIFIFGNEERIMLAARFDNLGKGASGAAVQCMNIMLGMNESIGLV